MGYAACVPSPWMCLEEPVSLKLPTEDASSLAELARRFRRGLDGHLHDLRIVGLMFIDDFEEINYKYKLPSITQ